MVKNDIGHRSPVPSIAQVECRLAAVLHTELQSWTLDHWQCCRSGNVEAAVLAALPPLPWGMLPVRMDPRTAVMALGRLWMEARAGHSACLPASEHSPCAASPFPAAWPPSLGHCLGSGLSTCSGYPAAADAPRLLADCQCCGPS